MTLGFRGISSLLTPAALAGCERLLVGATATAPACHPCVCSRFIAAWACCCKMNQSQAPGWIRSSRQGNLARVETRAMARRWEAARSGQVPGPSGAALSRHWRTDDCRAAHPCAIARTASPAEGKVTERSPAETRRPSGRQRGGARRPDLARGLRFLVFCRIQDVKRFLEHLLHAP
jgi:hypothetical protein